MSRRSGSAKLGPAGRPLLIDLGVCAKTGQATDERVTLRGHATPAWITVLLLFTVIGFLLANAMTARSYRITLPFVHAVHHRGRRTRRLAWAVGLAGIGALLTSATTGHGASNLWVGSSLALIIGGILIGAANALWNTVGVRMTRDDQLVITRAHPAFVLAVQDAIVEPGPVPRPHDPL